MGHKKKGTKTSAFGAGARIGHDATRFYDSNLYTSVQLQDAQGQEQPLPAKFLNKIIQASSENMKGVPDNSVHLMITSPPYNVTKEYDDNLNLEDYLTLLYNVFCETYRVLVNGGRACINIANVGRKPYIPLSDYISRMMYSIGFNMRGEIIWQKGAGAGVSMAWGSWQSASNPTLRDTHEYILVFSKGDYKRDPGNKENTITKEQFMDWTKSVWQMNTVSAKSIGHPAPFPEELPARLIQLYSYRDDIILDPFMGSGTTAIAAAKSGRNYLGFEINEEYVALANTRIKSET